jgi:hypothetical protein
MLQMARNRTAVVDVPPVSVRAQSGKRVALLVGNQENPYNDVARVGAALERVGFEIITVRDASFSQLDRALKGYIRKLNASGSASYRR